MSDEPRSANPDPQPVVDAPRDSTSDDAPADLRERNIRGNADPLWREKLQLIAQGEKLKAERKRLRETGGKKKNARRSRALKNRWRESRRNLFEEYETPEDTFEPRSQQGAPIAPVDRYNLYPQQFKQQFDTFLEAIYADMGGESELSTIEKALCRRLAQLEVLCDLYTVDVGVRGALTQAGKVRSTIDALYKAIDRCERLAKQLGLKRRTKNAGNTIADYIKAKASAPQA